MIENYREEMKRTRNESLSFEEKISEALFGVAGENGEVIDLIKKKEFHGHSPKTIREKMELELGDVLYYLTSLSDLIGKDFFDIIYNVADANKRKMPREWYLRNFSKASYNLIEAGLEALESVKSFGYVSKDYEINLMLGLRKYAGILRTFIETEAFNLNCVLERNVNKLKKRYPEGFSTKHSEQRIV